MMENEFFNEKEVIIYGGGLMGRNLSKAISELPYHPKVLRHIVNSIGNNPEEIYGVNVIPLSDAESYKNIPVLVALHEKYLYGAMDDLKKRGFTNLFPVSFDNDIWCDIREEWIIKNNLMPYGAKMLKSTNKDSRNEKTFHIYVVHSQYDKELVEDIPDKTYEISIQVGADLADKVLCSVQDDEGDNISEKNREYCELTGLYWVWKNDKSDYIGLSHYRRKFSLTDREIQSIITEDVDIVVTVPVMNLDTVRGQYIKDHCELDWQVMTKAINELSPEYADALETVGNGEFYFAYNMFIAKKVVLNNYCEWLFKILKYCEEKIGHKEDAYQNRYIGFLAERLLTVYIEKHKELNVVVAHKHFIETKRKKKTIVIYGDQAIALGAYNAIKDVYPEKNVECFLVTSMGNNAPVLGGILVRELNEFVAGMTQQEKDDIEVLIATPENLMGAIENSLEEVGLHNYKRLDSIRWAKLQEKGFTKNRKFIPLTTYLDGINTPDIHIFQMVHHRDKDLQTSYENPDYMTRLQVGVVNADKYVAELRDNELDNISEKNGNYSELTGLYWIWKNYVQAGKSEKGYVGLAHYRRFLEFSDNDLTKLRNNDIDVVLPYPMPYEPNIEAHHLRYLSNSEWNAVLQALDELKPEYSKAYKEILKQNYFYNYNVILAKSDVLDDYCSWLFPLLFRIEEINDPNGEKQPNRYIGYVGETLETLYFMHNKDKMKIAHTGCRFLV